MHFNAKVLVPSFHEYSPIGIRSTFGSNLSNYIWVMKFVHWTFGSLELFFPCFAAEYNHSLCPLHPPFSSSLPSPPPQPSHIHPSVLYVYCTIYDALLHCQYVTSCKYYIQLEETNAVSSLILATVYDNINLWTCDQIVNSSGHLFKSFLSL